MDDEVPGDIDEIEQAYRKALAAVAGLPWGAEQPAEKPPEAPSVDSRAVGSEAGTPSDRDPGQAPGNPGSLEGPRLALGTERAEDAAAGSQPMISPTQVIEAALFVGGPPLSAKKICALLRDTIDIAAIERTIDALNMQYTTEGRPYEIRPGDGGFRLELRPEYEKLRHRVYGTGPREVRLSQDVLEVLALVAYQQPIAQADIETHGKQNAGNLLRQLLRRDLVAIERGEGGRKNVKYVTTPRFLSVFGIGSLAELPAPEDLARR